MILLFIRSPGDTLPRRSRHPTALWHQHGKRKGLGSSSHGVLGALCPTRFGPLQSQVASTAPKRIPPSFHGTFFPPPCFLLWLLGAFSSSEEAVATGSGPRVDVPHSSVSSEEDFGVSREQPLEPQAARQRDQNTCCWENMFLGKGIKATC